MNIYFPNLNGVRCIAAFMVIFFHIELIKREFNLPNIESLLVFGGDLGVTLFFVLSGFLITYLLISEQHVTGTISIKSFYARRVLRIWPLYLIICILGMFIIPLCGDYFFEPKYANSIIENKTVIFFLYFMFLSNVLTATDSHVNFLRPTWSVSVEEQFYLMWPLLMKFFFKRPFVGYVIIIYFVLRIIFAILSHSYFQSDFPIFKFISNTLYHTPFDSLCVGASAAFLLYRNSKGEYIHFFHALYKRKFTFIIFMLFPILVYFTKVNISLDLIKGININFTKSIYSIYFAIIILSLASNPDLKLLLEYRVLKFLGRISYGLYLYHWFVIVFVLNLLLKFNIYYDSLLYTLSLGLTISVSTVSYYLFELRFLKLKRYFSKIISGDFVSK